VTEYTKKGQNAGQRTVATIRESLVVCSIHTTSHLECYHFANADKPSFMESLSNTMIK